MTLKKTAARAVATSMLGLAGLGVGAGLAQADPVGPMPTPPFPSPNVPGPGVNAGTPGNPLPPRRPWKCPRRSRRRRWQHSRTGLLWDLLLLSCVQNMEQTVYRM